MTYRICEHVIGWYEAVDDKGEVKLCADIGSVMSYVSNPPSDRR